KRMATGPQAMAARAMASISANKVTQVASESQGKGEPRPIPTPTPPTSQAAQATTFAIPTGGGVGPRQSLQPQEAPQVAKAAAKELSTPTFPSPPRIAATV